MAISHHFRLLLMLALAAGGCAGVNETSSSDEVQAFFAAANEANFQGALSVSSRQADLSAYTPLMGIKYPPTTSVEILSGPPARSYKAFAVLQCSPPLVLSQFTDKAKAIGADAIIICQAPGGSGQTSANQPGKVEALAIKYRLDAPGERTWRP